MNTNESFADFRENCRLYEPQYRCECSLIREENGHLNADNAHKNIECEEQICRRIKRPVPAEKKNCFFIGTDMECPDCKQRSCVYKLQE